MGDSLFMKIGQSTKQLPHDATYSPFWKSFILFNQLNKRSSFAVFHYKIVVSLKEVNLIKFNNIGMI